MASYIKTDKNVTVMFDDGAACTLLPDDPRWGRMVDAVRAQDWDNAYQIAFPANVLQEHFNQYEAAFGRVQITDGVVYFNDNPLHTTLTERMLEMLYEGHDISAMALFLDNLMDNPSYRAVSELYDFLEVSQLPITEDGHFLAYKRVRGDCTDIYSGKFDNSVGAVCEMPRNMVDEDKDRTCSAGLHFCGRDYLSFYGMGPSHRTMVVKINPADVVAIPSDHNNMKGRTAKYTVVDELEHDEGGKTPEDHLEGAFRPTVPDAADDDLTTGSETTFVDDVFEDDDMTNLEYSEKYPEAVVSLIPAQLYYEEFGYIGSLNERMLERYPDPLAASKNEPRAYPSNIRRCVAGERKTAGGFEWITMRRLLAAEAAEEPNDIDDVQVDDTVDHDDTSAKNAASWLRKMLGRA